ncbi:dickkopf-related protein 3b isoform X2 [Xiphophorus hellerii]|uniref:dickkopf-related protein 3b isoform X2 n=1 Tax=Xiphophorus hellerii TaxID=8084 RepID=UPI0013B46F18|nr:dickkopf-related protein 3-like isoform X2 [Xiphophorus hellerii]
MSGTMLLLGFWALCLLWTAGAMERGPVSLNEMFREVEELMEDTQHMLDEAVHKITNESAKFSSSPLDLPPDYHNETRKTVRGNNGETRILDRTDKETDNRTGETYTSHVHVEVSGQWNGVAHPCSKDEECCSDQMCVWGQCTVNATQGTAGTICQGQSDCRPDLCCAFQREFLFPVCSPKPLKGESCLNHPNLLMDMLEWDQEGPRDHCPCVANLHCQPHGRGSVCGE